MPIDPFARAMADEPAAFDRVLAWWRGGSYGDPPHLTMRAEVFGLRGVAKKPKPLSWAGTGRLDKVHPVDPGHLRRRRGDPPLTREDHVFEWGGSGRWARPDVDRVYFVDNVLTSGATMAAQGAVGGGTPLVWARSFDHDWRRQPRRRPALVESERL